MKIFQLIIVLSVSSFLAEAQTMTFTLASDPYVNLSNTTPVSSPGWYYANDYMLQLPFPFTYFGQTFDTLYFNSGFGGFVYISPSIYQGYEIHFFEAALIEKTPISTISYAVTGSIPNRVFKLQVKDAGFYNDQNITDYTNFQVWLLETSNVVELHYGPSVVVNPDSWMMSTCAGPNIILGQDQINFVMLTGPSNNPTAITSGAFTCVTDAPPSGTVYRFTPGPTSINENEKSQLNIFPNPSNGKFIIQSPELNQTFYIDIYNSIGSIVHSEIISSYKEEITSKLSPGFYTLHVYNKTKSLTRKVLVN